MELKNHVSMALLQLVNKAQLRPMSLVDENLFSPHWACKDDLFQGNHQNWKDAYH